MRQSLLRNLSYDNESNSKIIGFLIDFIKHNFDKNQEIKFLFIVHIKRKFLVFQNEEKTIDKIFLNES